ncbi:hypothetical protein AMATHDRAFT_58239 [Amanita thiersii Skay4041]|uniref:Phytase-like domain-containing protein n=1 Tax=Amanita thiersii Skay4041 TaxID=703135 RepID=A0A2A9NVR7_9AGAR|nr:hypothetical protein AMATHDRAFT_58239 [Amanita thiersii Skay4041]
MMVVAFVKFWVLLLSLSSALLSIHAAPYETNGERMARGLPPARPKFGRYVPGVVTREGPTAVSGAKYARTSPTPPTPFKGRLQVRTNEGHVLGNVRNWAGPASISGINFLGPDQDSIVEVLTTNPQKEPINIVVKNPAFDPPFFVGASANPSNSHIGLGLRNPLAFTNVDSTPPNSPPVPRGDRLVESAIWSFDHKTLELKAQWVNPDHSKPPTILAYDIRNNVLFFTGDIDAYNRDNSFPASAVHMFLLRE